MDRMRANKQPNYSIRQQFKQFGPIHKKISDSMHGHDQQTCPLHKPHS